MAELEAKQKVCWTDVTPVRPFCTLTLFRCNSDVNKRLFFSKQSMALECSEGGKGLLGTGLSASVHMQLHLCIRTADSRAMNRYEEHGGSQYLCSR